jgi:hypothetical protein
MRSDAFRRAVEALDLEATMATFSSSLVMHSPVRDEPLQGKESMAPLFAIRHRAPVPTLDAREKPSPRLSGILPACDPTSAVSLGSCEPRLLSAVARSC